MLFVLNVLLPVLLVILLVGMALGAVRILTLRRGGGVGIFAMIVGAFGIILPLLVLAGDSSRDVQLAVLISGSIVFGCGSIATAVARQKGEEASNDGS